MRPQTYRVELREDERVRLRMLTTQGQAPARVIRRAHLLLLASRGAPDHEVAAALHAHPTTVQRLRQRYALEGLDAALYDRPRPGAEPKLDARGEAFLGALACSDPPEDRDHWTSLDDADAGRPTGRAGRARAGRGDLGRDGSPGAGEKTS